MEYTTRYHEHDISITIEQADSVSTCSYRIDGGSSHPIETARPLPWTELRDDALALAKAEIDRMPG
jgi:hypothetical protein